jgi:hypothetical protein
MLAEYFCLIDKLAETDIFYKQFISLIEYIFDDLIFAPMRLCTKILLFLLFENKHLVTNMNIRKQPIGQHKVPSNIIFDRIGLGRDRGT